MCVRDFLCARFFYFSSDEYSLDDCFLNSQNNQRAASKKFDRARFDECLVICVLIVNPNLRGASNKTHNHFVLCAVINTFSAYPDNRIIIISRSLCTVWQQSMPCAASDCRLLEFRLVITQLSASVCCGHGHVRKRAGGRSAGAAK